MAVVLAGAAGCTAPRAVPPGRPTVVAGFYPLAEAVRQVGAGRFRVQDLTPAGAEPHDIEVTSRQVDAIEDARFVVVLGGGFQPAVEQALDRRDGPALRVLDTRPSLERRGDPHVWLDPVRMRTIVGLVAARLARAEPAARSAIERAAARYEARLDALDAEMRAALRDCRRRTLVTAHEAFGYLAARYGLRQEGIAGVSPEQEPDPERLAELADLVRREHVTTIFTESLVSPRVARTLAREAGGVRTAVLDPLETLDDAARRRGADYVSVMRDNLRKIGAALDCRSR